MSQKSGKSFETSISRIANIVKSLDPKQPAKGTCKCGILEGEKVKHYFALKQ